MNWSKPNRNNRRGKRRGTILVLAACLLAAVAVVSALAIDIGNMCVAKGELQRAADAAALAAAAAMWDRQDLNNQPAPSVVAGRARDNAVQYAGLNTCRSQALTLARNNNNVATGDLVLGHYNSTARTFDPANTRYNSALVRLRRDGTLNGPVPLFVAPVIGYTAQNMQAEAAAYLETDIRGFQIPPGSAATCGLLPFSLQIGLWQARTTARVDGYTHNATNQTASSGSDGIYEVSIFPDDLGPGNFGTIDIGNTNNSTTELSRQIRFGPNAADLAHYPNSTLQLGADGILKLNGDTGISASIKDDLAAIKGKPRILPLHTVVSGNGNTAWFDIVAFVGVTIVHVEMTGALKNRVVVVQPCYTTDPTAIGGGADGTTSAFLRTPPRLRAIP